VHIRIFTLSVYLFARNDPVISGWSSAIAKRIDEHQ
jgi:hypothetical protein